MPSINIYERDLTSPYSVDTTPNIVYIPGYANMGPIDTPVLCTTLSEFYSIFGSKPYKFKTAQGYPEIKEGSSPNEITYKFTDTAKPTSSMYQVGDFEKSFILAAELLSKNLPVLYERVASATLKQASKQISDFGTFKAKEEYSGLVGTDISIKIDRFNKSSDQTLDHYTLTVKLAQSAEFGVSEKVETFDFVISESATSGSIILYSDIDSSIVDIEWNIVGTPAAVSEVNLSDPDTYKTKDELEQIIKDFK